MISKKNTLVLIALTATLGLGGAALADRGGHQNEMMSGGKHGAMFGAGAGDYGHGKQGKHGKHRDPMHKLDLDDGQRAQLDQVRDSFEPQWDSLRERMMTNRQAMRDLQAAATLDVGQLGLLADEQGDLMAEMIKLRAVMHNQMQALLTAEQLEQMRERREHHHGREG